MRISRVGLDERGEFLLQRLCDAGLSGDAIQFDAVHPSGHVEIRMHGSTHAFTIALAQAWDFIAAAPALHALSGRQPHWFYFGTLAQRGRSRAALRSLLRTSATHGFLDVNLREDPVSRDVLEWSFAHAEVLKLNRDELERIAMLVGSDAPNPQTVAMGLIERFGLTRVIATEGAQGAWTIDRRAHLVCAVSGPEPEDFRDSVGAGDAFSAVCLLGLARGWSAETFLSRANDFAREICRIRGAVPDDAGFYASFRKRFAASAEAVA